MFTELKIHVTVNAIMIGLAVLCMEQYAIKLGLALCLQQSTGEYRIKIGLAVCLQQSTGGYITKIGLALRMQQSTVQYLIKIGLTAWHLWGVEKNVIKLGRIQRREIKILFSIGLVRQRMDFRNVNELRNVLRCFNERNKRCCELLRAMREMTKNVKLTRTMLVSWKSIAQHQVARAMVGQICRLRIQRRGGGYRQREGARQLSWWMTMDCQFDLVNVDQPWKV